MASAKEILVRLMSLMVAAVVMLTASLAVGADLEGTVDRWEELEGRRLALVEELGKMEAAHQNFVEALENLAERPGGRRERERLLRENLRVVEELEGIQSRMGELSLAQERVRGEVLEAIEARRQQLETGLREAASTGERLEYVSRLNDLQRERRRFISPLPRRDQERIAEVLALAGQIEAGHPRAMLAVADELEDTQEALLARLEGLDQQIGELERARRLQRRSRSFGEVQNFFDEDQRNRQIGTSAQASSTEGSGQQERAGSGEGEPQERFEADSAEAAAAPESEADWDDGAPEMSFDEALDGQADPDPGGEERWGEEFPAESEEREVEPRVELRDRLDADQGGEGRALTGRGLERDLERLRRERREIEAQAEELRREAEKLRQRAREGI